MQNKIVGQGSSHPISVISADLATWLREQGAHNLNLPDGFLNNLGGDLQRFFHDWGLPKDDLMLKSAPLSVGHAILFLSKFLGSMSNARAFNIGRCFNPEMVPGTAREMNQLDISFVGEQENLASSKGVIMHLVTLSLGQFTEFTILPMKFSFISPGGVVRIKCRFCDANGCVVCSKKGVVQVGVIGVVRSSIYDYFDPNKTKGGLANYIGLNMDVLAMQRYLLASRDNLYH